MKKEERLIIATAMLCLTDRERTVFVERHLFGLTYEKIGKVFGVTRGRIRQNYAKAVRKLRGQTFHSKCSMVVERFTPLYEEHQRRAAIKDLVWIYETLGIKV